MVWRTPRTAAQRVFNIPEMRNLILRSRAQQMRTPYWIGRNRLRRAGINRILSRHGPNTNPRFTRRYGPPTAAYNYTARRSLGLRTRWVRRR